MPIVTIKTIKGLLTKEKKQELHTRITDLLIEIEGNCNKKFAKFVIVNIKEEPFENFSMGGIQASPELFGMSSIDKSPT